MGDACDELVHNPFSCFPWYSRALIPPAKAVLDADAPPVSWIFPLSEPGKKKELCVSRGESRRLQKAPPAMARLSEQGGEGDTEAVPAETEGVHVEG